MKILIWYTSWTKHTEIYAEWLGKELKRTPVKAKEIQLSDLSNYDLIIYGGPIHSEEIVGFKRMRKIIPYLDDQRFIVFGVGGVAESDHYNEQIISKNFTDEERERVNFFYLRGGFDPERLEGIHKLQVRYFKFRLNRKKRESLTEAEKNLLHAFEHPDNYVEKENLETLVNYVTALKNQ